MILVELCAGFVIYFMIGLIVVSLFVLSSENFLETTPPNYLIKDILLWPVLVCGYIVGVIDTFNEHKEK